MSAASGNQVFRIKRVSRKKYRILGYSFFNHNVSRYLHRILSVKALKIIWGAQWLQRVNRVIFTCSYNFCPLRLIHSKSKLIYYSRWLNSWTMLLTFYLTDRLTFSKPYLGYILYRVAICGMLILVKTCALVQVGSTFGPHAAGCTSWRKGTYSTRTAARTRAASPGAAPAPTRRRRDAK